MVRRTKTDAMATRNALLDAAELLFQAHGVSHTTLSHIASAAGTTRGAIYWHFKDKADLFNAMMERISLPMEKTLAQVVQDAGEREDPLHMLRLSLADALDKMAHDPQTRRVFEVATHMVEYVQDMHAVRERHLRVRNDCTMWIAQALGASASYQSLRLPIPLDTAAMGMHMAVDGLIQNWLLDPAAFDLVNLGRMTVDTYLRGLGFSLTDAPAPRSAASRPSKAGASAKPPGPASSPKPVRSRKQTR